MVVALSPGKLIPAPARMPPMTPTLPRRSAGRFFRETIVSQTAKTAFTDLWPNTSTPKNGEIKRFLLIDVRPYIYCFHPAEPQRHPQRPL